MASKLFAKAKGLTKGLTNSNAAPQKDVQTLQRENRERELEMLNKLKFILSSIENSPDIKLDPAKINQFHIKQRIAKMIRSLDTTRVTEQDEKGLDDLIIFFIDCLETALKNGYENMAYWASIAVHHSTETLHIPVPQSDKEYAGMLYDRKFKYAQTLKLVIESARSLDSNQETLEGDTADYNRYRQELQRRKERYEAVKQSRGGAQLIQSTRQKINSRSNMTEEELEVFENLLKIRELSRAATGLNHKRSITMDAIRANDAAIQKYQSQLREKPAVEDEKIAARMKVIDTYFLDQLDARVSRTLAIDKLQDDFYTGLSDIAARVDRANAQRVSQTLDQMEMEAVDLRIAAKENAEMAQRIRENQHQLERMEHLLQESIREFEAQEEQNVQTYQEPEYEEEPADMDNEFETEDEFG